MSTRQRLFLLIAFIFCSFNLLAQNQIPDFQLNNLGENLVKTIYEMGKTGKPLPVTMEGNTSVLKLRDFPRVYSFFPSGYNPYTNQLPPLSGGSINVSFPWELIDPITHKDKVSIGLSSENYAQILLWRAIEIGIPDQLDSLKSDVKKYPFEKRSERLAQIVLQMVSNLKEAK